MPNKFSYLIAPHIKSHLNKFIISPAIFTVFEKHRLKNNDEIKVYFSSKFSKKCDFFHKKNIDAYQIVKKPGCALS